MDKKNKKNTKKLWLYLSDPVYELPLVVADSPQELAAIVGVKPNVPAQRISQYKCIGRWCKYAVVEVEMEDGETW